MGSELPENIPTMSVVIPCYKQAKYLATAIDSALIQGNTQVIVVDDGSPDDSEQVARQFGNRIQYIKQANAGVGAARNRGLTAANGDFVHFLDADDFLLPGMLGSHLDLMRSSNVDVTVSGLQWVDPEGKVIKTIPAVTFEPDAFHALLPINLCPPVCYLFKRSLVNSIGGFDPDRRKSGHEDWDFFLRIAATGARFARVDATLASYRVHGESASSRYASMYDSGRAVLKKNRALHPQCRACGDRFKNAFARFDHEYMDYLVKPALTGGMFKKKFRPVWKHLFLRSLGRPALAGTVVRRLITRAFRRASA